MAGAGALEKGGVKLEEQGMLFDYTTKLLLLAAFLELVLYRLVSRLGMHFSKVGEKHETVRITFKALSFIGPFLLNFVSLLVFLALFLLLFYKATAERRGRWDAFLVPAISLLTLLTVVHLFFPPTMLGSIVSNIVFFFILTLLVSEYYVSHPFWAQRGMILCFGLGITGWLYYKTMSTITTYGVLNLAAAPPFVHEAYRVGEGMMVLASMLVFWAYGATPLWSKNKRQRRRAAIFAVVAGSAFLTLLFLDYLLGLYDPSVADSVRKAGQGIGWIIQMGMGYTFYLPFALYVAGLLCWGYTVVKLVTIGRMAGIGLGLMFMAGYALQLSYMTLMVVLGLCLLNLDRRRLTGVVRESAADETLDVRPAASWLGGQA
jgi:hypothetical protein